MTTLTKYNRISDAREKKVCNVCEKPIAKCRVTSLPDRCTNGRCTACHRSYCTPGGIDGPGHACTWPKGMSERTPLT